MIFGSFALPDIGRFHAQQRTYDGGAAGGTPEALRWGVRGWEGMDLSIFSVWMQFAIWGIFAIWSYFICYFIIDEFRMVFSVNVPFAGWKLENFWISHLDSWFSWFKWQVCWRIWMMKERPPSRQEGWKQIWSPVTCQDLLCLFSDTRAMNSWWFHHIPHSFEARHGCTSSIARKLKHRKTHDSAIIPPSIPWVSMFFPPFPWSLRHRCPPSWSFQPRYSTEGPRSHSLDGSRSSNIIS